MGQEALELAPLRVEDPQRDVARARQVGGDLDQLLEQIIEVEVRDERAPGVDQAAQAGGGQRAGVPRGRMLAAGRPSFGAMSPTIFVAAIAVSPQRFGASLPMAGR